MTQNPEALWAVIGLIGGLLCSIMTGVVLLWAKRTAQTRDKQSDLAASLTGIHVSVEHLGRSVDELRADTKDRWTRVSDRLDSLPCKDLCANVTTLRRESDERRKAVP